MAAGQVSASSSFVPRVIGLVASDLVAAQGPTSFGLGLEVADLLAWRL